MYHHEVRSYVDPAWGRFRSALSALMTRDASPEHPVLTSAALALQLGVEQEVVSAWRKGRARPTLEQLFEIGPAISRLRKLEDGDALQLFRNMGVIGDRTVGDSELVDMALRLQKLELKLAHAQSMSNAFSRTGAAGSVVAAAVKSGHWAVAVWPDWEGPVDYKLHISDRLDFRRLDGNPPSVWEDQSLKRALRSVYATPSLGRPRWSDESEGVEFWSIPHVGKPRAPMVTSSWPMLSSVGCISLSKSAWVHDFGSLLALAIGYGATTTRDLALEITGALNNRDSAATLVADRLVQRAPGRRVWSHEGDIPHGLVAGLPSERPDSALIWLRERGELLDSRDLRESRHATMNSLISRSGSRQILVQDIDVHLNRDTNWEALLRAVSDTLATLINTRRLPDDPQAYTQVHDELREDPGVGSVLLDFLGAQPHPFPPRRRAARGSHRVER